MISSSQRPLPDNTHNRQTSMPSVGFEPTISAGERPQTYALDRAATGTSYVCVCVCVCVYIYIYIRIRATDWFLREYKIPAFPAFTKVSNAFVKYFYCLPLRCLQYYDKETPGLIWKPIFFLVWHLRVLVFSCSIFFSPINEHNLHVPKVFYHSVCFASSCQSF